MSVYACYGCFSPSAHAVTINVGGIFGIAHPVRMQFCHSCDLKIWRNWPVRR